VTVERGTCCVGGEPRGEDMPVHFQRELAKLNERVLGLGALVKENLHLVQGEVVRRDDPRCVDDPLEQAPDGGSCSSS
jgi:hypothetical protein